MELNKIDSQTEISNVQPNLQKLFLAKTLDEACEHFNNFIKQRFPNVSMCLVLTHDPVTNTLNCKDFLNLPVHEDLPSGKAMTTRRVQLCVNAPLDEKLQKWRGFFKEQNICSILSYPILSSGDSKEEMPLGALVIYFSTPLEKIPEDWPLLNLFLPMLAAIIEKNKFKEKIEEALQQLQTSQERLKLALKSQKMGVWDWHIQSNKLIWDEAMFELYGLDPKEATGTFEDWKKCVHPDDLEQATTIIKDVFANLKQFDHQFRVVKNGEIRFVAANAHLIRDEKGNPFRMTGLNWDVTEKVHIQQKISQRQAALVAHAKMATLGEMSSAIAHEINNPLMIILNTAERLRLKLYKMENIEEAKVEVSNETSRIEKTVERIAKIIRGLKAFSRNANHDPKISCEIHQVINESLDLCRQKLKQDNIQLRLNLPLKPLYFLGRPSQISQVLLNLINNSIDAIKNSTSPWIELQLAQNQDQICLKLIDSGLGISHDVADKMMEPFFTTKEIGKGTGLGLSIAKGLIEDHEGQFYLDRMCPNTCFVINLPIDKTPIVSAHIENIDLNEEAPPL